MGLSVHRVRAFEARRINHPVFPDIHKFWLTVPANEFPRGISTAANAREPVGMNRRVYREVKASLTAKDGAVPGTFDLMNKGITILAVDVKLVDKPNNIYELTIDDEDGGIVDGAHTARIIGEAQDAGNIPDEQHVEVYVRTNVTGGLITDIARGLNTSVQVAAKSIYDIDGVFNWLKAEIADQPYAYSFAWKESDAAEYDVRDLVGVLEVFNVFDFPPDAGKHPISAYEKWSVVLDRFARDYNEHGESQDSVYYRLRKLLVGGLALYDYVRRDFYRMNNDMGGAAGKMNIIDTATPKNGPFEFPFAGLPPADHRLTKGAAFPILAAFRNYVEIDEVTGDAEWRGGIDAVIEEWKQVGPELVTATREAIKDYGRNPDQLGKSRPHWAKLHMWVQLRVLRSQLTQQGKMTRRSR
jgi:AIPR protein